MTPKITLTDAPDPAARKAIVEPLVRFNAEQVGRPVDYLPLAILLSDPETDKVIGGLWGDTMFLHLYINLLFIPEPLRHAGLGSQILRQAETEAIRRGCHGAWLDTYSFQALGFYERNGYTAFGTLEDYPPGHSRIFLRKSLGVA
jgi:GNAT superfamily N-acetyltransferase